MPGSAPSPSSAFSGMRLSHPASLAGQSTTNANTGASNAGGVPSSTDKEGGGGVGGPAGAASSSSGAGDMQVFIFSLFPDFVFIIRSVLERFFVFCAAGMILEVLCCPLPRCSYRRLAGQNTLEMLSTHAWYAHTTVESEENLDLCDGYLFRGVLRDGERHGSSLSSTATANLLH